MRQLTEEGHWCLRTATVMPDHLHLLITLGEQSELSAVIRLFKGRLAPALRTSGHRWQQGCFDHRLRVGEDQLPVFLYVFLNAYRANLVKPDQQWPGYFCAQEDWQWFGPLTNASCPFPEWLSL